MVKTPTEGRIRLKGGKAEENINADVKQASGQLLTRHGGQEPPEGGGAPASLPEARWECARCRDTGWIETRDAERPDYSRAAPCGCRQDAAKGALLKESRIPPRFAHCAFDSFRGKERMIPALRFVEQYPADKGLLFMGPPGVGKTHLAVAVLRALTERFGARCLFEDFSDLLSRIRASYAPRVQISDAERTILAPVFNAEVLLLDDLGAARPSDWVLDTLYLIINTRYTNRRMTLATTNYLDSYKGRQEKQETLAERVSERIRSRLYEMCKEVVMESADYRRRQKP